MVNPIKDGNMWFVDSAGEKSAEPNWIPNSVMVWKIPIGWHRRGMSDDAFSVSRPDYEFFWQNETRALIGARQYSQRFTIDGNGVFKIEKYGHWISRSPSCQVILDGETQQQSHQSP